MDAFFIVLFKTPGARRKYLPIIESLKGWLQKTGLSLGRDIQERSTQVGHLLALVPHSTPWNVPVFFDHQGVTFSAPNPLINVHHSQSLSDYQKDLSRLIDHPASGRSYAAPYSLAYLGEGIGGVFTDPLGLRRCYEYENDEIHVSSNHIACCAAFTPDLQEDKEAWLIFSGVGWFVRDTTPIRGVNRVLPLTHISSHGGATRKYAYGDYAEYFQSQVSESNLYAQAEDELRMFFRNLGLLSSRQLVTNLSGGRDSRLTTAAALASGADLTVKTIDSLSGEVETASQLMKLVGRSEAHQIASLSSSTHVQSISERLSNAMLVWDGDVAPNTVGRDTSLVPSSVVSIGGGGGEIAHGNYYATRKLLDAVIAAPRPTDRLKKAFGGALGTTPEGSRLIGDYLDAIHDDMVRYGLKGPSILDGFYLVERFRRWVTAGHRQLSIVPFACPSFVTLAMIQTPEQRFENTVHRRLTNALVPGWGDVPFYKAKPNERDEKTEKGLRLWQGERNRDFDEVAAQAIQDEIWDTAALQAGLERIHQGVDLGRMDSTFQRVFWKHGFDSHLQMLRSDTTFGKHVQLSALETSFP